MSDRAHAEYPPSSLEHYNNCPGYLPSKEPAGWAAERGQKLHKAWETGNLAGLTEEEQRAVYTVKSECYEGGTIYREFILQAKGLTWGTADYLCVAGRTAYLVDAKFGRLSVPVTTDNIQMWAYCLGIWFKWPAVDEIHVKVVCPFRGESSTATFRRSTHYQSFFNFIVRIIEKTELYRRTGDPTLLSYTEKTCSFCVRADCPIKIKRMADAFNVPKTVQCLAPVKMTPEQISEAKLLAIQFRRWAKAVDDKAQEMSDAGVEIPGFERKYRAGSREVLGQEISSVFHLVSKIVELPSSGLQSALTLSLPKTEKIVSDLSPQGQKKVNVEKFQDALRDADIGQSTAGTYYLKVKPEIYDEK